MSRCDLHIHSRHSARSEEWLFRRFDFPDSYSDPKRVAPDSCANAGWIMLPLPITTRSMAALEIAHLPRTFISEQVTTYFPHDACKLHILVWGISEAATSRYRKASAKTSSTFSGTCSRRKSLTQSRTRFTASTANSRHIAPRAAILLFKHFEGINGLRDALLSDLTQTLFKQLTPRKNRRVCQSPRSCAYASRSHGRKILVGGSDDHGGQFRRARPSQKRRPRSRPTNFSKSVRDW